MVWACIEKRRRICPQESDGDGGAREKKESKTEEEVVGQHQERQFSLRQVQWRHLIRNIDPA